jgi:hypothetical protein
VSEINAPATLTTPGGVILFNDYSGSAYYHFTDVQGLDQAPLRISRDKKPQAPGAIVHKTLQDARTPTFAGTVVATSVAQRNTMTQALITALESIENADGTYVWTPTGLAAKTLTVRCDINVTYTGKLVKDFAFGLVAANPAIT